MIIVICLVFNHYLSLDRTYKLTPRIGDARVHSQSGVGSDIHIAMEVNEEQRDWTSGSLLPVSTLF